ncbi:MAG: putative selenate ABC transporter substrate-binding protein [Planctomycetota bacterium]|jgi:phosphonate transport system substrate-binding protein
MKLRLLALAVLAFSLTGCPGSQEGAEPVLRFTAIPDQNTTELKAKYDPVAAHLSQVLGVKVEYVPATDYQASVEMFKNGDVQLAWFGGLTGVQARAAVSGAHAIAQGEADPRYKSYFIAHASTGLEASEDFPAAIASLPFAFGSESSTSGRLMPEFFIRKNTGKAPVDFFAQAPVFSGSHDKTVELVESGKVKVGAVNYKVYDKRVKSGQTDPAICKKIWTTPPYADYNFTAHPDLEKSFGAGFTLKLQTALLAIDDEKLMSAFLRKRFIAATDADFLGIARIAEDLGMVRAKSTP